MRGAHASGSASPSDPRAIGSEANDETRQAASRWRLKLSHKPAVGFARLHRIDQLDDSLMDVIALRALECPDVKARGGGCDTRQRGHHSALWT